MSSEIARRYADALLALAAEQGSLETVAGELDTFSSVLKDSEELSAALTNPGFSLSERQGVVSALLEKGQAGTTTRNFLFLLVDNDRMPAFPAILAAFQAQVDERLGRVRATVSSATALDSSTLAEIKKQVQQLTGKDEVILDSEVDPSLIGGIVTRVGDLLLDGSIRTQLSTIRTKLAGQMPAGEA
ncbi:MAG: ATP synthase F1 subunit delta [Myxococcota bacterium]|nr:ATP synthase F1 subunit delta [Myxococcota bacterium]